MFNMQMQYVQKANAVLTTKLVNKKDAFLLTSPSIIASSKAHGYDQANS
jgi:hypothetical protein